MLSAGRGIPIVSLDQRDTYFVARRGRLELRDQGRDGSELIAYRRGNATELRDATRDLGIPLAEGVYLAEAVRAPNTLGDTPPEVPSAVIEAQRAV